MEELEKKAEQLVTQKITGHRKGLPDEPNYRHSFRVRDLIKETSDSENREVAIAGLLHDIIEDGEVSFEELRILGCTDRIIDLIELCSHRMDIEDNTERWLFMMAKLTEAGDKDAWHIKIADIADNLTQCHGLSKENRKFMIETKVPLFLRLTEKLLPEKEIERTRKILITNAQQAASSLPQQVHSTPHLL
jgi:(p)ppGpp synthase/HD superfamily hydrolase